MMRKSFMLVLLVPVLAGCASQGPVRGRVAAATTGGPFQDFSFVDDRGKARTFGSILGDFTVISFASSDEGSYASAIDVLKAILAENRFAQGAVDVVAVDIHWSKAGLEARQGCPAVHQTKAISTIYDETGARRRLYGIPEGDWIYVVGPNRTVVLRAPVGNANALRSELTDRIQTYSHKGEKGTIPPVD
jgi:hypothetical protein